jgi:SAM-dependent methyltransferase
MKKQQINNSLASRYYKNQEQFHNFDYRVIARTQNKSGEVTIDKWRHLRMFSFVNPITKIDPKASWLTVGDCYGDDASYLVGLGANVLATDISDSQLKEAKKSHHIKKYKKENAEKLSFKEDSFDYILCKESFHHFPRPMVALYEMLRVARKAVILIEPNDVHIRGIGWKRFWSVEDLKTRANSFEISGNYVYTISRREIEKAGLGIGLPAVAFLGFDDIYIEKASNDKITDNTFSFRKIKAVLWVLDILYRLRMRDRSVLVSIVFKERPGRKLVRELINLGYKVKILPKNPYIKP